MTLNIFDFRANVQSGFQKPCKYRVFFPIPAAMFSSPLYQNFYATLQSLEFYSNSIDFIGVNMSTVPLFRYGYGSPQEIAYAPMFRNIMATFYADQDGDNLYFFQQWASLLNNFDMSGGITGVDIQGVNTYENYYRDDYVVDAQITLLDQSGDDVCTWCMRSAFPKMIPEIKLDWSLVNEPMRVTVIFAYNDWYNMYSPDAAITNNLVNDFDNPTGVPGVIQNTVAE